MPFSLIPDRLYSRYPDLTPRLLHDLQIRLLLCDLDYTLAPAPWKSRTRRFMPGWTTAGTRASR